MASPIGLDVKADVELAITYFNRWVTVDDVRCKCTEFGRVLHCKAVAEDADEFTSRLVRVKVGYATTEEGDAAVKALHIRFTFPPPAGETDDPIYLHAVYADSSRLCSSYGDNMRSTWNLRGPVKLYLYPLTLDSESDKTESNGSCGTVLDTGSSQGGTSSNCVSASEVQHLLSMYMPGDAILHVVVRPCNDSTSSFAGYTTPLQRRLMGDDFQATVWIRLATDAQPIIDAYEAASEYNSGLASDECMHVWYSHSSQFIPPHARVWGPQ